MNIVKPLQLGVLHKSFTYLEKDVFALSIPIAFSLIDGEILLEQKLWSTIGEQLDGEIFDGAMPKEVGEVLVCGNFIAPQGQSVEAGSVHLQLGRIDSKGLYATLVDKELAVFGDRRWYKALGAGLGISTAEPITQMTMSYANAFGGEGYPLNPIGKGLTEVETDTGDIQFLPNIEYKNTRITSSSAKAAPASLGRVDIMWQQRSPLAGTYDEAYLNEVMPGLPNDINWLYFNDAAEDQWLPSYFVGDEHYSITNMHSVHREFKGQLPPIYGRGFVNQRCGTGDEKKTVFKEVKTKLDTLWLFPNEAMGVMIYRGTIEGHCDDGTDIESLLLACENRNDPPRSLAHYQDQMTKRICPDHGYKYALLSTPLIAEGMRCGFKQVVDEYDFPLEMLGKDNMDAFAESKTQEALGQAEDAKAQVVEQLKAAGIDPAPYIEKMNNPEKAPEQAQMEALLEKMAPGMVSDPKNVEISKIDMSVMDEIKIFTDQLAENKIAEAKAQVVDEIAKLKADPNAAMYADAIATMEQKLVEIDLPPLWPRPEINGQIEEIKTQISSAESEIDNLRKMGVSEDKLPKIDVDIQDIEAKLLDAEVKLKETYVMGAHLMGEARSPHPKEEARLREELLRAFAAGESLSDKDFACIDLSNLDLQGIDLSGSYLEGVDFTGVDLSGANLTGAILAGANLTDAKLHDACCAGANIGAANLTNTDFSGCDLTKAVLGNSKLIHTDFSRCTLSEMNFLEVEFERAIFDDAIMIQCNFIEPTLNGCSFVGCDLTGSNMVKPQLEKANFSQATLDGVNFVEANAVGANFSQAQMVNSRFVGGCNLNDCSFSGAQISQSCLRENEINNSDFSHANLSEADFSGSQLANSNFEGALALRTQFMKSNLLNANLSRFNLMEGSLYKAYLVGANFDHSNLYCVNFMDCTLGNNSYKNTNLDQTVLKDWRPS